MGKEEEKFGGGEGKKRGAKENIREEGILLDKEKEGKRAREKEERGKEGRREGEVLRGKGTDEEGGKGEN